LENYSEIHVYICLEVKFIISIVGSTVVLKELEKQGFGMNSTSNLTPLVID